MVNNKKIGNSTEKKLLDRLQENGTWCHLFSYNANGQPCDVVAFKDDNGFLIDVKHCVGNKFYFKNIQDNQLSCFAYYVSCGNSDTSCGFAIYFESINAFRWASYRKVKKMIELEYNGIMIDDCEVFL